MKLPRSAQIWLMPYLRDRLRKQLRPRRPKRVWLAITDHYEPWGMGASVETAMARVGAWHEARSVAEAGATKLEPTVHNESRHIYMAFMRITAAFVIGAPRKSMT